MPFLFPLECLRAGRLGRLQLSGSNAPVIWNPRTPPPIWALVRDCEDFHLIYTSFWFPGRQGIRIKTWSSINETTTTIKIFWHTHCALRSFCKLFAGHCSVIDQNVVRTKKWHMRCSWVCQWCSYHILTSSVIYYWSDAPQHGIY